MTVRRSRFHSTRGAPAFGSQVTLASGRHNGAHVGQPAGGLVEEGVGAAVEFTDTISHEEKLACYRAADVFVCLSEHEGFKVPVVESMHFGIPVVALAEAAVPETVGDAGVTFSGITTFRR